MALQDNLITTLNLYKQNKLAKQIPILLKHGKSINNMINDKDNLILINEYEKFSLNYNVAFIHVIGLDNFKCKKKGPVTYYYSNRADSYPIKVLNNNDQIIVTLIIGVNSKYFPLKDNDRIQMIHKLEAFDRKLAADSQLNMNLKSSEQINYTIDKRDINIFIIMALLSEYHNIMILFHEIIRDPLCFIDKQYYQTRHLKRIDNTTIKLSLCAPGLKRYSFKKHINYDTEENHWIKKIAIEIMQLSYRSIKYLKQKGYYKSQPYYWNSFIKYLKNIHSYLSFITQETFLNAISDHIMSIPLKLLYSSKYNLVYRMYKRIFSSKFRLDFKLLEKYRYSYLVKPTSTLYELWTYIYVLKTLISFGYKIQNITYLNHTINLTDFLSYGLQHGNAFILNKELVTLRVEYNDSIDYNSKAPMWIYNSNIDNTFKIRKLRNHSKYRGHKGLHDKPDIRIDIMYRNCYEGSIILDAKCSDQEYVSKSPSDIHQLLSYRFNAIYKKADLYKKYLDSFYPNPIQKVFVIFAGKRNQIYGINGIVFIKIRPNYKINFRENSLINAINNCIRSAIILKKYNSERN